MLRVETLTARGHPNILGTHKMTFELTKDLELSRRGDCVIGVGADKGPLDLSREFKENCCREGARISVTLEVLGMVDTIHGCGSPALTFTHPSEMVGRRSQFASDRTVMVGADKAACDLDKRLLQALRMSTNGLYCKHSVGL